MLSISYKNDGGDEDDDDDGDDDDEDDNDILDDDEGMVLNMKISILRQTPQTCIQRMLSYLTFSCQSRCGEV